MQYKFVERYYPVTLTKRSQICKAKQFFFKKNHNTKIIGNIKKMISSFKDGNYMFKVSSRNSRMGC